MTTNSSGMKDVQRVVVIVLCVWQMTFLFSFFSVLYNGFQKCKNGLKSAGLIKREVGWVLILYSQMKTNFMPAPAFKESFLCRFISLCWRDSSATGSFCRGPGLGSRYPHGGSQLFVTLAPEGTLQALYTHAGKTTHTGFSILKKTCHLSISCQASLGYGGRNCRVLFITMKSICC